MIPLTPSEIVAQLDRYIIGHQEAKRAVAIALRNRWRRQQVASPLKEEILPKNILMMGPTGVGKTEIARRLARLADAPFIKVEATKFTEVGYVGRDVEQIVRDLLEAAIAKVKDSHRESVQSKAKQQMEERILEALVGTNASVETREKFKAMLESGQLEDKEVEIDLADNAAFSNAFDIPGMPGTQIGMLNLSDMMSNALGINKTKRRKLTVREARHLITGEESEKLIDHEKTIREAIFAVEQNGIVFIDEIDKVCAKNNSSSADVSREGVQRDLLPLIEGCAVTTKHGIVHTDHILFIASGAFHISKPSDLLPELQGRLPIRVELKNLDEKDFCRILKETDSSLIKQYKALLAVEGVTIDFTDDGIDEVAKLAATINSNIENIGARRLHTIIEKLLEDISFSADIRSGESLIINKEYVQEKVGHLAEQKDLSRFIL